MAGELTAIDCDVHPTVPGIRALVPYLDEFWRQTLVDREINLETNSYPPEAPITARPDWRDSKGRAATEVSDLRTQVMERLGSSHAICNCLYGVQLLFSEDMANVVAKAVNDWMVKEWLDKEPGLRASIVVPIQNVEDSVAEIERCAKDPRFVQVLLLAMGEAPLGRRQFWPIYEAASRHGLAIGIHAGSSYRHPPTSVGWPTYYLEDYACNSQGFQSQVASLICEGVFSKFPDLKIVLLESGVTWLPGFMWRLSKFWRGVRSEIPWVDRSPFEIVKSNFRMTIQPLDAPDEPEMVRRALDHLESDDMLLFSSDFPHWQFDDDQVVPAGISPDLLRKMKVDNPLATYARLREAV